MTKMIGNLEIPHLNFNHQAASSALTSETGDVLTMKCAATLEDFLCSSEKPSAYDCSEVADIPDEMEWIFTDKYSKIINLGNTDFGTFNLSTYCILQMMSFC